MGVNFDTSMAADRERIRANLEQALATLLELAAETACEKSPQAVTQVGEGTQHQFPLNPNEPLGAYVSVLVSKKGAPQTYQTYFIDATGQPWRITLQRETPIKSSLTE